MPRTGGVYSPPAGTKGVSNTTIQSVPYNAFVDDLTADANAARPITAGGTGATTASGARTALGAQTASAALSSIAGLTTSADKLPYTTAADTYAVTTLTAFGRSLIDDADASAALTTLGVSTFAKTILDDADAATARATLGANNASNLTTGTVPDARISGAYSGITTLSTTGLMTVTNAGEAFRLNGPAAADDPYITFYAGGVRNAYIQHTDGTGTGNGFRFFNDVTDDYLYLSNVNTVDALKFYDASVTTHQTVYHSGNLTITSFARTLLDDASNSAARTTLDVYSKAEVNSLSSSSVPAGTVIFYAKSTAPSGYLKANGAAVSRTTYADLFAAIGTTFGSGDGSTTFNLPDLRGEFLRGWDDARGADSGRVFGSAQGANIQAHTHSVDPPSTATSSDTHSHTFSATTSTNGAHTHTAPSTTSGGVGNGRVLEGNATENNTVSINSAGDHTHTVSGTTGSDTHNHTVDIAAFTSGSAGSGTDTRPRNVALLACIKF